MSECLEWLVCDLCKCHIAEVDRWGKWMVCEDCFSELEESFSGFLTMTDEKIEEILENEREEKRHEKN